MQDRQPDLFGHVAPVSRRRPRRKAITLRFARVAPGEYWVNDQAKDQVLGSLGIRRKDGQTHLQAWRDAMVSESGTSLAEVRKVIDWQVNILGNEALAAFIWAIA